MKCYIRLYCWLLTLHVFEKLYYHIHFSICFFFSSLSFQWHLQQFDIMLLYTKWTRRKFLIILILIWCRLIGQNIIGVNCNLNRLHNILMRNTFPCVINSLCMCTNAGNGTHSYKISCHDVWFYKFTGKKIKCNMYQVSM